MKVRRLKEFIFIVSYNVSYVTQKVKKQYLDRFISLSMKSPFIINDALPLAHIYVDIQV